MNVKKISKMAGLSTLLLMSTAADAGWKGNFLLGAEGGYAWRDGNLNTVILNHASIPPRAILSNTHDSKGLNDGAAMWGLLAGYQVMCNRLLLGLEANIDWHGSEDTKTFHQLQPAFNLATRVDNLGSASFERGTTVGLSMRAGYQAMRWLMPYLRVGVETSRDTLTYNSSIVSTIGPLLPVTTFAEDKERTYRFVGGAGLEIATMVQQLAFRAEYNYVPNSKRVKATGSSLEPNAVGPGSPIQEHFVDTKQDQHLAKLALVWNFR